MSNNNISAVFFGTLDHRVRKCPKCELYNPICKVDEKDGDNFFETREYFKCASCNTEYSNLMYKQSASGNFAGWKTLWFNPFVIGEGKVALYVSQNKVLDIISNKLLNIKNVNIEGDYLGAGKENKPDDYICNNFKDIKRQNYKVGIARCPECGKINLSYKIKEINKVWARNIFYCDCGCNFKEKRYAWNIKNGVKYNAELRLMQKVQSKKTGKKYWAVKFEEYYYVITGEKEYIRQHESKFERII